MSEDTYDKIVSVLNNELPTRWIRNSSLRPGTVKAGTPTQILTTDSSGDTAWSAPAI